MYLSVLFLFIIYVLSFAITNYTSKDIIEKVNNKKNDENYFLKKYLFYLTFSIAYVIMIYIVGSGKKILNDVQLSVWVAMCAIHSHTLIVTIITDEIVKRINRHLLRFSYILNYVGILYLIITTTEGSYLWSIVAQVVCLLVLFVGFVYTDIGASDFRCLFITLPTMLYLYGVKAVVPVFIMMLLITVYFFIQKKRHGAKEEVPIGAPILLTNLIFSTIAFIF